MWLVNYNFAAMAVQTWSFAGGVWQQLAPATTVTPLQWFELVTEPGTGRVMLFGGYESVAGSAVVKDDLWFFDGVDWQQHTSAVAPPPRYFGQSIRDLDVQARTGVHIVLLRKRKATDGMPAIRVPTADDVIEEGEESSATFGRHLSRMMS